MSAMTQVPGGSMLGSETLERLVLFFLLRPGEGAHFRGLQRHLQVSSRPLQVELGRLSELGLLSRGRDGRKVVYRAQLDHPGWDALERMLRVFRPPVDVLREAFTGVPGVEAALVFGPVARGEERAGSDIDVLLIGEGIPAGALGRTLQESSAILGCEVNVVRLSRRELAEQLARGDYFVRDVARGPKQWIFGRDRLPELAA